MSTPAKTSSAAPGMAPQPSWTNTNSSQPVAPVEETSNVDDPISSSSNADAAEEDASSQKYPILNCTFLKFINTTSFVLTAMVVLFGVREEGVLFGDEFLWMRYQVRDKLTFMIVDLHIWLRSVK